MKTTLTLAEVKAIYGETCFETETSFGVNMFGKYQPNITFIIPKVFDLGKDGKPISPMSYMEDREVTDNMNLDFDGSASFIFGDFWRSKKGGACFRPKNPMQAKHLLIEVEWGGCFNKHRGTLPEDAAKIDDVLYFRRAKSNQGGLGSDYWVVPVGFTRVIHDEEIDGGIKADQAKLFEQRAEAYCKRHADLRKAAIEEADAYLKEKASAEEASRKNKHKYLPRLIMIQHELLVLSLAQEYGRYSVDELSYDEDGFKLGCHRYLYDENGLAEAKKYLSRTREWVEKSEAKKREQAALEAEFTPKFEALRPQVEEIGWELSFRDEGVLVNIPGNGQSKYSYSYEGVDGLCKDIKRAADRIAEEETRIRNAERIHKILSEVDFPESLWYLFEGSEDLDQVIAAEAKAILTARIAEKDELDMHELGNCGYDRRCEAIRRVLKRVGGGNATLNIKSQAESRSLAWYIYG